MGGNLIVSDRLDKYVDYELWSIQVKTYLLGQDLWHVVEADEPCATHEDNSEAEITAWRKKNATALHAIQVSCESNALLVIKEISSARIAWATLAAEFLENKEKKSETEEDSSSENNETSNIFKETNGEIEEDSSSENNETNSEIEEEENEDMNSEVETDSSSTNSQTKNTSKNQGIHDEKENNNINDGFQRHRQFFNAVRNGNWEAAKTYLDKHPEALRATIPISGQNALHIAIKAGHVSIVEELVALMTEEDLEMKDTYNRTVLATAINETRSVGIAKCLIKKNKKLVSISYSVYGLPVSNALWFGQLEMARYLYSVTPEDDLISRENGLYGTLLICCSIYSKNFDMALHLLDRCPRLALTECDHHDNAAVYSLSYSNVQASGFRLRFLQRWIYDLIEVPSCATNHIYVDVQHKNASQSDRDKTVISSGIVQRCRKVILCLLGQMVSYLLQILDVKNIKEMKLIHVQSSELLSRVCEAIGSTSDYKLLKDAGVHDAIFEAVRNNNAEFIKRIIKANPELLWNPSIFNKVFLLAIELRHAEVFSLIYGLHNRKEIAGYFDGKTEDNMLHKVASVAPQSILNDIPGAALQMQRQLQWYKEVEANVSFISRYDRNKKGKKPYELFTENNKLLVTEGEKWTKDTSSSCTVVGALIITIMFAAAFTVPGGYDQNTGYPMFLSKKLFKVFIISDALSLFSSTTSVLVFLGILTSRYGQEDFFKSLPTKLIIGLSTLFFSIATMMIAFCAALTIILREEKWIAVPVVLLATIPIALFGWMQFPLLVDIFMSTYGPSIFNRKVEPWL